MPGAIGGLAASTFLTLLVVPVVYTLVDDAQSGVLRGWRALRGWLLTWAARAS